MSYKTLNSKRNILQKWLIIIIALFLSVLMWHFSPKILDFIFLKDLPVDISGPCYSLNEQQCKLRSDCSVEISLTGIKPANHCIQKY